MAALVLCQLPYLQVWRTGAPFAYDALTSYTPWHVRLLDDLQHGRRLFALMQDWHPAQVMPPYAFTVLVRQLSAPWMVNSYSAHAYVQAGHVSLAVLAAAALYRTFGLSWVAAWLGAFVYMTSGTSVSLSQHVSQHESLAYLPASLFFIRVYFLRRDMATGLERMGWLAASGLAIVSLWRWYHELVHLFLPIIAWVLGHMFVAMRRVDWTGRLRMAFEWAAVGALVAVGVWPTVVTALEMSLFNKTLVAEYGQFAVPAFRSPALYAGSFVLPFVTGGAALQTRSFSFGTDPTLAYNFVGTATPVLVLLALGGWWRQRPRHAFWIVVILFVLFVGFSYGVGSPIHWLLCHAFPPLGRMRHSYFGFWLTYLLAGFCVGSGWDRLRHEPTRAALPATLVAIVCVPALYLWLARIDAAPYFRGTAQGYRTALHHDLLLLGLAQALFVLPAALAFVSWRRTALACVAAVAVVLPADLVRAAYGQHFVPPPAPVTHWRSFDGTLIAAAPMMSHIATSPHGRLGWRNPRVLPIGIGHWGNTVYLVGAGAVSGMDSQGNRFFESRLARVGTGADADRLARDFGVDYFWVSSEAGFWVARLDEQPTFRRVATSPWLGSLYAYHPPPRPAEARASVDWFSGPERIRRSDGQFGSVFSVELAGMPRPETGSLTLPFMWMRFFDVRDERGQPVAFDRTEDGRMSVSVGTGATRLQLAYPSAPVRTLMGLAVLSEGLLLLAAALSIGAWLARSPRRGVAAPPGRSESAGSDSPDGVTTSRADQWYDAGPSAGTRGARPTRGWSGP